MDLGRGWAEPLCRVWVGWNVYKLLVACSPVAGGLLMQIHLFLDLLSILSFLIHLVILLSKFDVNCRKLGTSTCLSKFSSHDLAYKLDFSCKVQLYLRVVQSIPVSSLLFSKICSWPKPPAHPLSHPLAQCPRLPPPKAYPCGAHASSHHAKAEL